MKAPDRKSARRKIVASMFLILIAAVLLLISTQSLAGLPKRFGLTVFSLFQRVFTEVGSFVGNTINSISELRQLQENHRHLLERVESFGRMEREYTDIKQENDRLRALLGLYEESSYRSISGKIIAKDPGNLYSTFIVDRGEIHGIRKNQAVIAYQNGLEGLVGRVIDVARSTCLIVPIFDSGSYIAVRMDKSRYEGLASGSGSDELPLVVQYIKKRARDEIQFGDLVVTSGLQSLYPPNIKVGRVSKLRLLDYLASMELEIEPIIDFSRLEYVFIITQGNSRDSAGSGGGL
jgi:rod shape-determining protein MreC